MWGLLGQEGEARGVLLLEDIWRNPKREEWYLPIGRMAAVFI